MRQFARRMSTWRTRSFGKPNKMGTGWLRKQIARNRRNSLVRQTAHRCKTFLSSYNNDNYDQATNGEFYILEALSRFPLRTVFDVGANVGDWTRAARTAFPQASIHAFEISQKTFARLAENTSSLPNVQCVNIGLAEKEGTVTLHYYEQQPGLTTIFDYPHAFPKIEIPAPVTTGDLYCNQNDVTHIDFMKIDAEGMDHLILAGFANLLKNGAIDLIQFEYGQVSILSKFLLYDFYALLNRHGYTVGKIFPNFVDFRDYSMHDEDFIGPNYLACRSEKKEYIQALT